MQKLTTDIAIVAAGPSGLTAAISAAENGAEVMVFEKMSVAGGTANMGMGPFGVESRIQKELMDDLTKEEAFRIMMDYTHWTVDARLVRDYFWKSGSTIDWLEDMGVVFDRPTKYYPGGYATWHVVKPEDGSQPGPRAASAMIKVLFRRANELGVKFFLSTPVKEILVEDNVVKGLRAVSENGEEYEVSAKAVIMATGGFGANSEMIRDYTGYTWGKDLFSFQIPGVTGDGLRMAWAAGAGKGRMTMERITNFAISTAEKYISYMTFDQPRSLVVNQLGERVMNEEEVRNGAVFANVIERQPGRYCWMIMTDKIVKQYIRHGLDYGNNVIRFNYAELFNDELPGMMADYPEDIFAADSVEELEQMLGIEEGALVDTVDEYNDACDEHYDDILLKDRKYLQAIEGKKYYACRVFSGAYGSLGGIRINHKFEVLTEDWKKIRGFYAVGSDVCDLYNGTYQYMLSGNTMGFAVNSGRMAGEYAVDYADSLEE